MPEGGIVKLYADNVIVRAEDSLPLEDGEYVRISIEDQGTGIPGNHLQRIFDPFFTTKQEGSGLGLATSYSVIKRHGGHIIVESQMGVGTTFQVYLPASPGAVLSEMMGDENEIPVTGSGKVLVMDDEKHVSDLAAEMLSSIGYKVTTTIEGAEAVEMYEQARDSGEPYDAVIIDLTVPGGMDGKETIEKLVNIDPEIKAAVSSGYSNDPIMADFRDYGFKGVIAKPYKVMELSAVLYGIMRE